MMFHTALILDVDGIPVALHGCHTSCGAKLISASGGRQRSGDDMECLT